EATALLGEEATSWESGPDQQTRWFSRQVEVAQGGERWSVVVTQTGLARTRATLAQRAQRDRDHWERQLWHLGNQACASQAEAHAAQQRPLTPLPVWLRVVSTVSSQPHYARKGRPSKDQPPNRETWQVQAQVTIDQEQLARAAQRQARFLVATNVLDS